MWLNIKYFFTPVLLVVSLLYANAQDNILLTEKPGTFKITYGTLIGYGPDQYGNSCDFTKTESDAITKNLVSLVEIFRRNPVLKDIKGFDGYCYLNSGRFDKRFGYGLPSTPCFFFAPWVLRNGRTVKLTSEPPQWRFEVNMPGKFCGNGFSGSTFQNEYRPTNAAYNAQSIYKVAVELGELFYLPGKKEEVSPGIDRYGDNLILFNPDRPEYWSSVSIREVFRLLIDYWRLAPDKIQVEAIVPLLEGEFSNFTEVEKDGPAYFGRPETISRIGSEKNESPVMRPNPDYWNRKLPRSAIQFMWLEIPPKEIVKNMMKDRLKRQDGYYYVSRLLYELDVNTLHSLIAR